MTAGPKDSDAANEREERIYSEILVDAYHPEEQALSWYYYLEKNLPFPFEARCVRERSDSPLCRGETIQVTGLPSEERWMDEMRVTIDWDDRTFAVPLSQLDGIDLNAEAQQALADCAYWNG